MSRRLLFVVHDVASSDLPAQLAERFGADSLTISDALPRDVEAYDLGVLWNYRRVVPGLAAHRNLVVFHAAALPQDRGWAPIYHTIAQSRPRVTVSALRPVDAVDAGMLVAQASFASHPAYTAPMIRRWIAHASLRVADELSRDGRIRTMAGRAQTGCGNQNPRRTPADGEVEGSSTLRSLMPQLRAAEPAHPAFVEYEGVRYIVTVNPAVEPPLPEVTIEYYD